MGCFYTNRSIGFSWLNGMRCCFFSFFHCFSYFKIQVLIPMLCRHLPALFVVGCGNLFNFQWVFGRSLATLRAEPLGKSIVLSFGDYRHYQPFKQWRCAGDAPIDIPTLRSCTDPFPVTISTFFRVFSGPRQQLLVSGVRLWAAKCVWSLRFLVGFFCVNVQWVYQCIPSGTFT